MYVNASGKQMEFHEVVKALLMEEHDKSEKEAERLVKIYPNVIIQGIMMKMAYRPTALALLMEDKNGS